MEAKEQHGQLAQWAMKLQLYEFNIMYQPGAKHMNTNTMTRPLVVSDDDIVSVVSKPQAKRAAAIQGQEFVQQVATNPYSNVAHAATH
jgi:hypothetical protein